MKLYIKILLTVVVFSYQKTDAVVILVHGSFATLSTWCKPKGLFYQELEKQAALIHQNLIPFSWSGIPKDSEIVQGAEALVRTILSYPADEEIILIGHSHGGNVINFASHLLHDCLTEMLHVTSHNTISSIIMQTYHSFSLDNQITLPTNEPKPSSQNMSFLQDYLPTTKGKKSKTLFKTVMNAINRVEHYKLQHKEMNPNKKMKQYIIEKVYTLGTPVHAKKYPPQMKVIKTFVHLYSVADFIQPVFGLYKRTYPMHERMVNLSVSMHGKGNFLFPHKPKHDELHDPLIAQWILAIPETLQAQKLGNFENFFYEQNGYIHFEQGKTPLYNDIKNNDTQSKKSLRTLIPQALF